MVNLDWRVESREGVTLVELVVENPTATARRVRVGNRLDGAVWPPRRRGVPEAGWDDGGFEGVLGPGDRRALGYASPASPVEPPAEVVWTERAGATEPAETTDSTVEPAPAGDVDSAPTGNVEPTPEGVVRALGDARPPADAVPTPSESDDSDARWSP